MRSNPWPGPWFPYRLRVRFRPSSEARSLTSHILYNRDRMVTLGISTLPTARSTDIAVLARRAEELGFDSIWVPEQHTLPVTVENPVPRLWGDIVDPLIALARASAATTTLKLGTAVVVVPARNPITLAKEVATLDMYSGGRFLFGIGVGGLREEGELLGVDFDRRWTQGREAVEAMKELWTQDESAYQGRYYGFPPGVLLPQARGQAAPADHSGQHGPQRLQEDRRLGRWVAPAGRDGRAGRRRTGRAGPPHRAERARSGLHRDFRHGRARRPRSRSSATPMRAPTASSSASKATRTARTWPRWRRSPAR